MILALVTLTLYAVFFLYLVLAGAGLARTLGVLRTAAWQAVLMGLVIGGVVALFSPEGGLQAFLIVITLSSLVMLPTASLSRARDFVLPSSSALEVVCLNVLVLTIGAPSRSFAFLDTFFQGGFQLLLNPFARFMPAWLGLALSLWPAVLALHVAASGTQSSHRARFCLNLWVHLMSIVWVLPAAIGSLLAFEAKSPLTYVEVLFACLGLVYVVLTWMTLRDAVFGKRTHLEGEVSLDSTARGGVARALADRMDPGRLHPAALAAAGLVTYLVIWLSLMYFLSLQTAGSIGFMLVVVGGALLSRGGRPATETGTPARPATAWLLSAAALIVLMALVRPLAMELLAARQHAVYSLDHAEVRQPRDLRAADASQRLCDFKMENMALLDCHRNQFWALSAVNHPDDVAEPTGFDLDEAHEYALEFGGRTLHCVQMRAQARREGGAMDEVTMLLVYVPGATDASQYAWTQERDAACARVVEVIRPRQSGFGPGFGYRGQQLLWLGELKAASQPLR